MLDMKKLWPASQAETFHIIVCHLRKIGIPVCIYSETVPNLQKFGSYIGSTGRSRSAGIRAGARSQWR